MCSSNICKCLVSEKVRRRELGKYGFQVLFLDDEDLDVKDWKERCLFKIREFEAVKLTEVSGKKFKSNEAERGGQG